MSASQALSDVEKQRLIEYLESGAVNDDCFVERDYDQDYFVRVETVLQLWGAWTRYGSGGTGYSSSLQSSTASAPSITDEDALLVDGVIGTLKIINYPVFEVMQCFYVDYGRVSSVQKALNLSREKVNMLLGSGKSYVCAVLFFSEIKKSLKNSLQFAR